MKKNLIYTALFALLLAALSGAPAEAQTRMFDVTVTNLTKSQIMSPPLVVTHSENIALFELGEAASDELAAIAEDADYAGMLTLLDNSPQVHDFDLGADVILPGNSMTVRVEGSRDAPIYSVVGMLVTTNDSFYSLTRTLSAGPSSSIALAYDSGSEANTEDCAHIPGPPCDNPFVRVTEGAEGFVYFAPGIDGIASLPSSVWNWNGPVAKVSVQIVP